MTKNQKIGVGVGVSLPILGIAIPLLFFPKTEKQLYAFGLGALGLILALPVAAGTKSLSDKINPKGK